MVALSLWLSEEVRSSGATDTAWEETVCRDLCLSLCFAFKTFQSKCFRFLENVIFRKM